MVKVGITGGIGSGKSFICRMFSMLQIPIYFADERAKYLMNHNPEVRNSLINKFGTMLYVQDELNRSMLSQIIFNDHLALEFVNSIVHPAVGNDYLEWVKQNTTVHYCMMEAALLFESNLYKELDCVITVVSPHETRIQRVMMRDKISYDLVMERIRNQWNDQEKMKHADYIIYNDNHHSLIEQMLFIHNQIIAL